MKSTWQKIRQGTLNTQRRNKDSLDYETQERTNSVRGTDEHRAMKEPITPNTATGKALIWIGEMEK